MYQEKYCYVKRCRAKYPTHTQTQTKPRGRAAAAEIIAYFDSVVAVGRAAQRIYELALAPRERVDELAPDEERVGARLARGARLVDRPRARERDRAKGQVGEQPARDAGAEAGDADREADLRGERRDGWVVVGG